MKMPLPFTNEPINFLMRLGCIAVYAAGAAGALGLAPPPYAAAMVTVAVFVLAAHAAELILLRRHLGLYGGPRRKAIMLALLFGSLHWFPLLQEQRRSQAVRS